MGLYTIVYPPLNINYINFELLHKYGLSYRY